MSNLDPESQAISLTPGTYRAPDVVQARKAAVGDGTEVRRLLPQRTKAAHKTSPKFAVAGATQAVSAQVPAARGTIVRGWPGRNRDPTGLRFPALRSYHQLCATKPRRP